MKKRLHTSVFILVLSAFTTASAQANLLVNGGFESGAAGWTEWSLNPTTNWTTGEFQHTYSNTTDIHVPTFYPYAGNISHSQKVLTAGVHGGLLQVVDVQPGHEYSVSGAWSCGIGGVVDPAPYTIAWFEITVYDGAVGASAVDQAPGANDAVIVKQEYTNGAPVFFDWTTFSNTFTANSNQVTLALKAGKAGGSADYIACHHDELNIVDVNQRVSVPALSGVALVLLSMLMVGIAIFRLRRSYSS